MIGSRLFAFACHFSLWLGGERLIYDVGDAGAALPSQVAPPEISDRRPEIAPLHAASLFPSSLLSLDSTFHPPLSPPQAGHATLQFALMNLSPASSSKK